MPLPISLYMLAVGSVLMLGGLQTEALAALALGICFEITGFVINGLPDREVPVARDEDL